MTFTYDRIVYFKDTDAAGVVYFANVLAICHEAYEASLAASGINLKQFFRGSTTAIPITHADVDFYRPMFCGDRISIQLEVQQLSSQEFSIDYRICNELEQVLSKATTKHICIDPNNRTRADLPDEILHWLKAV